MTVVISAMELDGYRRQHPDVELPENVETLVLYFADELDELELLDIEATDDQGEEIDVDVEDIESLVAAAEILEIGTQI